MKIEMNQNYESPSVEVIEVVVEGGFATSNYGENSTVTNGIWDPE